MENEELTKNFLNDAVDRSTYLIDRSFKNHIINLGFSTIFLELGYKKKKKFWSKNDCLRINYHADKLEIWLTNKMQKVVIDFDKSKSTYHAYTLVPYTVDNIIQGVQVISLDSLSQVSYVADFSRIRHHISRNMHYYNDEILIEPGEYEIRSTSSSYHPVMIDYHAESMHQKYLPLLEWGKCSMVINQNKILHEVD